MSRTTQSPNNLKQYEFSYTELCFSIWYSAGQPSMDRLVTLLPPDEIYKTIPSVATLRGWSTDGYWMDRAQKIDADVQEGTDRALVQIRMKMMQKHAEQAAEIAEKAYQYLVTEGFDSSTSAVTGWKHATEVEKSSRGLAGALTRVFSMTDDQLKLEMDRLLAGKNLDLLVEEEKKEDIVDGEVEEEDDGIQEE